MTSEHREIETLGHGYSGNRNMDQKDISRTAILPYTVLRIFLNHIHLIFYNYGKHWNNILKATSGPCMHTVENI